MESTYVEMQNIIYFREIVRMACLSTVEYFRKGFFEKKKFLTVKNCISCIRSKTCML